MIYKFNKDTLSYQKVTLKAVFIALGLVLVSSLVVGLMNMNKINQIRFISQETKNIILKEHNEFTPERLREYITQLQIKYPDIVYAQAVIESGNFRSQLFRENSNLYGMKQANRRATTSEGNQFGYAYYSDWLKSVEDYALWQNTIIGNIKSEKDYLEFLHQYYAEDTTYVDKIRKIIR
jgi:hypothetical protein